MFSLVSTANTLSRLAQNMCLKVAGHRFGVTSSSQSMARRIKLCKPKSRALTDAQHGKKSVSSRTKAPTWLTLATFPSSRRIEVAIAASLRHSTKFCHWGLEVGSYSFCPRRRSDRIIVTAVNAVLLLRSI